ncbi:MAG: 50S ribosomal protein L21 [candidate division Zixibacteria bacterium]|nr:50S ribosomal protein L21 [candidate division Zixibacteria bacterium]
MYAIMESGGLQFKIEEGAKIKIPKLEAKPGDEVVFDKVLLISQEEKEPLIGMPYLENAKITAEVLSTGKGKKVLIYKFKKRVKYRRKRGHRQEYTEIKINKINLSKKSKS